MRTQCFARALIVAACLVGVASIVSAQGVEVSPFAGYRFGGDFFEVVTAHPVDRDGAPAFGVVVDVPLWNGLQFEALWTHQSADILVPAAPPGATARVVVEHFQGGGLQEFGTGAVRPFLTGMLGLSRYAAAGDSELRVSMGAGGGVKLFPSRLVGLRLDGRVFATFVDLEGRAGVCSSNGCALAFHADVVWQAEFTAGLVVRLR